MQLVQMPVLLFRYGETDFKHSLCWPARWPVVEENLLPATGERVGEMRSWIHRVTRQVNWLLLVGCRTLFALQMSPISLISNCTRVWLGRNWLGFFFSKKSLSLLGVAQNGRYGIFTWWDYNLFKCLTFLSNWLGHVCLSRFDELVRLSIIRLEHRFPKIDLCFGI